MLDRETEIAEQKCGRRDGAKETGRVKLGGERKSRERRKLGNETEKEKEKKRK